ncbi:MAG: alpha/beta hydrolase [Carnobacterium sp.]|uniref:alpha/beta hydrolase n=1 Tax=Carnobacterium sp. TaxID=48221 RepID=UPI00331520EE
MKRKLWISLAVLVAMIIIGLGFAGNYFYDVAVAINPKDFIEATNVDGDYDPEDPWLEEKKWYDEVERKEVSLESADGLNLSGVYIESESTSKKVAILAHGYAGNLEQMAPYVKLYHDMGFNVLVPDARGHGTSEGDYIGFGWHERKDYLQWIQLMIDKVGTDAELALFGISMGGATVMNVSGEELPDNVKVIVEDCGYSSLNGELAYQLKDMYDLPEFPLIPVTSLVTKVRSGYWFGEADTVEQIKKNKVPMLFIHGAEDKFVPTDMVYDVYEANSSPKELYIASNADHADSYEENKEEYEQKVQEFVLKYVSQ